MEIIDKSFTQRPVSYIVQTLVATVVIGLILYFIEVLTHAFIVAALGASTFIVFAMPHSTTAEPRRLVGGHILGLVSGTALYYIFLAGPLRELTINSQLMFCIASALAVGLLIFLMTITNTEHPPASATALSVVAYGWSYQLAIFILAGVAGLALARWALGNRLKDLV